MMSKLKLVAIVLPILVLVGLRSPTIFESYWYSDEGIYAAVAQEMTQGKKLYRDVWDHKPPLTFLVFYSVAALGWDIGFPLLKIINIGCGVATLVFVDVILKSRVGHLPRLLSLLFLSAFLGSTILGGNAINAEVMFIVFNILAFILLVYKKQFTLVGFLGFLSLMTKVPGFVEFGLFLITFFVVYWKEKGFIYLRHAATRVGLGFAIPLSLVVSYFYLQGTLSDFIDANIIFNIGYSLKKYSFTTLLGTEFPNTLLTTFSLVSFFFFSCYFYLRKKLSGFAFLAVNLFAAQIFSSLLSGRSYSHYFIQVLPGATLLLALAFQRFKEGICFSQAALAFILFLLLTPAFLVSGSIDEMPVYAPPKDYYYSFFKGYVLGDELSKNNFWWRNGEEVKMTRIIADFFNKHYLERNPAYIYTDKPWLLALVGRDLTNKYVTWFHLTYSDRYMNEEIENMRRSDLFILDKDARLLEAVSKELAYGFEKIGDYENVDVYKRK